MKTILTTLVVLCFFASPALAKRYEYNFNSCTYNTYDSVNPMNKTPIYAPTGSLNQGIGNTGASAEKLRTAIPMSLYEQTPQRTITLTNPKRQKTRLVQVNNYQQQQRQAYYYVPGQNGQATQNSNQSGVSYQYNSSGAATYSSADNNTNK